MDPTPTEMATFTTLDHVADWAGLAGSAADISTPRGALWAVLGTVANTQPRLIAAMPEADLEALLGAWRITGNPPTPAQLAAGRLVGRACRITAGTQLTAAEERAQREQAAQIALLQAQAAVAAGAPAPPHTAPHRMVRLNLVVNQVTDESRPALGATALEAAYQHYVTVMGAMPSDLDECTADQLTAIQALLQEGSVPYTDFAVWGPFGNRLQRKMLLTGLSFRPDGTLVKVELKGPPDLETWHSCYRLLRTARISFQAVTVARLDAYNDLIHRYAARYSRSTWHLVYQADVRCRLENMERLRRRGAAEHATATAAGGTHPYDPAHPWEYVWDQAVLESPFWTRELEEPALLVLSRAANLGALLGDDTAVESIGATTSARSTRGASPPRTRQTTPSSGARRERPAKVHRVSGDLYSANRTGAHCCEDWLRGGCTDRPGRCLTHPERTHQCNKCLGQHRLDTCSLKPLEPSAWKGRSDARGAGRGRRGKGRG
jgi:hypothetical protein